MPLVDNDGHESPPRESGAPEFEPFENKEFQSEVEDRRLPSPIIPDVFLQWTRENSLYDKGADGSDDTAERKRGKAKRKRGERKPLQAKDTAASHLTARTDHLTEETANIKCSSMPPKSDTKDKPANPLSYEKKSLKGKFRKNSDAQDSKCELRADSPCTFKKDGGLLDQEIGKCPETGAKGKNAKEVQEAVNNSEKPTPFLKDYSRYNPAEDDDHESLKAPSVITNFMPKTLVDIPVVQLRGVSIWPVMNWFELGLTDKMRKHIGEVCTMSTSQAASYLAPLFLDGHDVKACVRVTPEDYLIPLTWKLIEDNVRYEDTYDEQQDKVMPYAVVICADESRCDDVYRVARQIASRNHLKTRKSSGDESERQFQRSMQRLMGSCHLLCTTVMRGNLLFNMLKGAVSAKKVRYLILDDMQKLTGDDMEYHREVLMTLLQMFPTNDNRQTLFLSASDVSLVDCLARASLKKSFAELTYE